MTFPQPFAYGLETANLPQDWDCYACLVDEKSASCYLNLALNDIFPIPTKPNVLFVQIKMNQPREDGLSSEEEFQPLIDLEDAVIAQISEQLEAIYVGRMTTNGHRDLFFYFSDNSEIGNIVHGIMQQFTDYQYNIGAKPDPQGSIYLDYLYPNQRQLATIQQRRLKAL